MYQHTFLINSIKGLLLMALLRVNLYQLVLMEFYMTIYNGTVMGFFSASVGSRIARGN